MTTTLARLAVFALGMATVAASTPSFTYDDAGRLLTADYGGGRRITYSYDNNGNLLGRIVNLDPPPIPPTMTAQKNGADIDITYDIVACNATDHAVLFGAFGNFTDVTAADCSIGNTGNATVTPPGGNVWFLIPGVEGAEYSSVGNASAGPRVLNGVTAACGTLTTLDASAGCP